MFNSVTIPYNSLRPRQIGRQLPEDTFKRIKFNKMLELWLNFTDVVPKGPMDNTASFVQEMTWRRTGDKPLSETMAP